MSITEVNNVKGILHFLTVNRQRCPEFHVSNCTVDFYFLSMLSKVLYHKGIANGAEIYLPLF
jgi:hypothetical protein